MLSIAAFELRINFVPLDPKEPVIIWAALREKVPNIVSRCHTKRRMDG